MFEATVLNFQDKRSRQATLCREIIARAFPEGGARIEWHLGWGELSNCEKDEFLSGTGLEELVTANEMDEIFKAATRVVIPVHPNSEPTWNARLTLSILNRTQFDPQAKKLLQGVAFFKF